MPNVTARTAPLPPSAPPAPPTNADIGKLQKNVTDAGTKVESLKKGLKAARDALLQSPGNPRLTQKQNDLLAKTKAAMGEQDKAQGALDAALPQMAPGKTPRERTANLSGQLDKLDGDVAAASKDETASTEQLKKDVAAAEAIPKTSPQRQVALAKAEASSKKAQAAADKRQQLEAARAPLTKELQAREGATLAESKARNLPGAAQTADVIDLASRTREEQQRLAGAAVPGVSRQQAADADRQKVAMATNSSPANGARMLSLQLQGADSMQQHMLVQALSDPKQNVLGKLADEAQSRPEVATTMLDSMKAAGRLARGGMADALAKSTTSMESPVMKSLQARMKTGEGFTEADALAGSLEKAGNTELAGKLRAVMAVRIGELKDNFKEANDQVGKLNGDLARLAVGFGPMMSSDDQQKAIASFKQRHLKEYNAWEDSGARLSRAAEYLGDSKTTQADAALLLPDALSTQGGQKAVVDALAKQEVGEHTFLDSLAGYADEGKDGLKTAGGITTAVTKGVAQRALSLAQAGDKAGAEKAIESIKANHKLLGLDKEPAERMVEKLKAVLKGGGEEALHGLQEETTLAEANAPGFHGRGGQAIRGLGLVLGIVGQVDAWGKFKNLDLSLQVKTVADAVGVGVDGGMLAIDVLGKAEKWTNLTLLGKSAGGAVGAIGAVVDGISAAKAFRAGEYAEGVASSASAVGGALLATAAFTAAAGVQVVPVAGQVVGAVLVVGGTIAKYSIGAWKAHRAEKDMENDAQAFLEATGVPSPQADELSDLVRADGRNVGPFLQQLADKLHMKPTELWQFIKHLPPDKLDDLVDMQKDLVPDKEGHFPDTAANDSTALAPRTAQHAQEVSHVYLGPLSMTAALEWMRSAGMVPAGH